MNPSRSEMPLAPHALGGERRHWSWEVLLWALSAALVVAGALFLWRARELGSVDLGSASASVLMDPETGEVLSCERDGGPCPWALATSSLEYALALPALGSGLIGLLLGVALRAHRGKSLTQIGAEAEPHAASGAEAETLTRPKPQAHAETTHFAAQGVQTSPAVAPASPPRPRSTRGHAPDSLARYMPPASQPGTDQEDSAS